MIQMEPSDPANYFELAKIYEDAGAYPEAEQMLPERQERQAERPGRLHAARGVLQPPGPVRQDDRGARAARPVEPNNPEAFHTIAGYYWDETQRDVRLNDTQKRDYVQKGLEAADKALSSRATTWKR